MTDLDSRIPDLGDPEMEVGMQRIVAMAGDGHASVVLPFLPLPIALRWFADGLYVAAAPADAARAVGFRYVVEDAFGARFTVEVTPSFAAPVEAPDPAAGFVPYWRRNTGSAYWFTYLQSARTLYLAYNACQNIPGLPFIAFAQQVFSTIDANGIGRLVVDVRNNPGGDSRVVQPLYDGIKARRARLQVNAIIGWRTASSGM
ncbi:MAG: hypothetical protein LAP87_29075 [Acidobacteriia bacterium]|nr:hypothetical protein [Terriglobia bacterium]